ncbi:hypothetical protein MPSEU_000833100 [Mayamaea pseudoterrestris]|nr:hypothetical protein MPSEU_000833100 [Mayamaea pseudoterrestris]
MSRQQQQQHVYCGICHEPYNEPIFHPDCISLSESIRDDLEDLEFLDKRMNFGPRQHKRTAAASIATTPFAPNLPTLDETMPVVSAFGDRTKSFTSRPSIEKKTHALEQRRRSTVLADIRKRRTSYQTNPLSQQQVVVDGRDVFQKYDPDKPANSVVRWNLLWLVFCCLAPYPLWLTFVPHGGCKLSYELTILMNVMLTINFMYTTILCWKYMWRMIRAFNTPFWQELDLETRNKLKHIVVMPTYKEPVELLCETISSIANQTVAGSIVLVVGMEERTPDQERKRLLIRERFEHKFCALVFSVHPAGVPGEIPGACSNRNHAARTAVRYMIDEGLLPVDPVTRELEFDFCTISVCDADTTYYYRYFENLSWAFLNEPPESRYQVCWQSPLFYNISLDKRWFFTRVMGILRSYFMIGFLIGGNINTMSIYSMSLGLLVKSQFFHPGYQMDDIIYTLSAMRATGVRIKIRTLDIPTLSGPTSGENFLAEFNEWVIQATRWTIGAAEVFHYFFVKLLKRNYFLPGLAYFWWFVYYYGYVLCISGLVAISNLIAQFAGLAHEEYAIGTCRPCQNWFGLEDDSAFYAWIMPAFLFFNYAIVFSTAFIMDALVSQILALDEQISPLRNILHWLSSQLVLWVYCVVEYRAVIRIAIYGKDVCGHKASEKHALVGVEAEFSTRGDSNHEEEIPKYSSRSSTSAKLPRVDETSHHEDSSNEFEGDTGPLSFFRGSERHPSSSFKAAMSQQVGRGTFDLSNQILLFEESQSMDGSKLSVTDEGSGGDSRESSRSVNIWDEQRIYEIMSELKETSQLHTLGDSQFSLPYDERKTANEGGYREFLQMAGGSTVRNGLITNKSIGEIITELKEKSQLKLMGDSQFSLPYDELKVGSEGDYHEPPQISGWSTAKHDESPPSGASASALVDQPLSDGPSEENQARSESMHFI